MEKIIRERIKELEELVRSLESLGRTASLNEEILEKMREIHEKLTRSLMDILATLNNAEFKRIEAEQDLKSW